MKKRTALLRRFVSGALALALCLTLNFFSAPTAHATALDDLKDQASELAAEAKDLKSVLNRLNKQENAKLEEKEILEQEISVIENQIATSQEILDLKEAELAAAEAEEQEYFDLFCKRFRNMEESRTINIWTILFGSVSFADFLDRLNFVAQVAMYDNNILSQLTEARNEVAKARDEVAASHKELEDHKAALKEEEAAIDAVLADIEAERDKYKDELAALQRQLDRVEDEIASYNPPVLGGTTGSGSFIWPTTSRRITSYFGNRNQPTAGASKNHKGIDIGASKGTPIYASDGGTVTISTYSDSAGHYIKIDHGNGMATVYMHCNTRKVKVGDTVAKGQVIATVGSTGISTGPHLHFGILKNGTYVNPLNYVSP